MAGKKLDVYYHQQHIGTLAEMPDKRIAFQYSAQWQKNGFSINPLSLPLCNDVFIPSKDNPKTLQGLHGVFADSLPDAWGELLMRNYFESIKVSVNNFSVLDKLAYIGTSGMGALEYYPCKNLDYNISQIGMTYDEIARECNNILASKKSSQLDVLYQLAGSSGGTRPKILLHDQGKDWIIKFPSQHDTQNSGKREYDYAICAKDCGIHMTETELIPSTTCDGYFKTERFDRQNNQKIFVATFAGLLNIDYNAPSCDYSIYMKLIQVLTKDNQYDKQQMYKQMCFNVLTHNFDDHTKNFSFIFTENQGWHLSPAYDITYSNTYFGEHTTSVNGKGVNITDTDLYTVGEGGNLSHDYVMNELSQIKNHCVTLKHYLEPQQDIQRKKTSIKTRVHELTR